MVPFHSWSEFFPAFTLSNTSSFYAQQFPDYADYIETGNGNDEDIIKHLLKLGMPVQAGLDGFVRAILAGPRFVCDYPIAMKACLKLFLDAGAKLTSGTMDILFERTYDQDNSIYIEDEVNNYRARAMIITLFGELVSFKPQEHIETWDSIEPIYWEETAAREDLSLDEKRLMHMRYAVTYYY